MNEVTKAECEAQNQKTRENAAKHYLGQLNSWVNNMQPQVKAVWKEKFPKIAGTYDELTAKNWQKVTYVDQFCKKNIDSLQKNYEFKKIYLLS